MTSASVLLTGGSGFIATHILTKLLEQGFQVVTTVRTTSKGDELLRNIPDRQHHLVSYVLVEDIRKEGAFDESIKNIPSLDYVIHTASPVIAKPDDVMNDVIEPALNGATGILKSILKYGPTVKRLVLTSSTAAVVTPGKAKLHDEDDWSPMTLEMALANPTMAYSTSKTMAEKAAWRFMEISQPHFELAVVNNTWTFGPINVSDIDHVNISNQRVRDIVMGRMKDSLAPTAPAFTWVDVRDVATAHVKALTKDGAAGKRFVIAAGDFSNKKIVDIIRRKFSSLNGLLPGENEKDDSENQTVTLNNKRSKEILGLEYLGLDESITDTVSSMLRIMEGDKIQEVEGSI